MLFIRAIFLVLFTAGCSAVPSQTVVASSPTSAPTSRPTSQPVDRWRKEIDAYQDQDRLNAPAKGGVVFVGASSIRGWKTLKQDFPGLNVIGRGFGGSQSIDVIRYADVLVLKHRPRVVVFYAGENDIASGTASPADVLRRIHTFCDLVHRELPTTRIVVISLKPAPSRMKHIDAVRTTNALLAEYVATDDRLRFVDIFSKMIDNTGQPRPELYVGDRLHMTPAGYAIWRDAVEPHLE